jgi:hypothetical protein
MGEIKDWIGEEIMTERIDLWKFNGGVKPKFWFGDRVKVGERSATLNYPTKNGKVKRYLDVVIPGLSQPRNNRLIRLI